MLTFISTLSFCAGLGSGTVILGWLPFKQLKTCLLHRSTLLVCCITACILHKTNRFSNKKRHVKIQLTVLITEMVNYERLVFNETLVKRKRNKLFSLLVGS